MDYGPQRIVCLTEEPTEVLYLLGEDHRIVGVSGFTVRPKRARKEKPTISTFTDAKVDQIKELKPDLVIGFSDIQAEIAKELIAEGITVWINNYRSLEDCFKMIVQLGALVGKKEKAIDWVVERKNRIAEMEKVSNQWEKKPKVYFEEWYDPIIVGIRWVSEIVEAAGGIDIFSNFKEGSLAKDRIIEDQQRILKEKPDVILASWCGKMFKPKRMFEREGWKELEAYKNQQYFEIPSPIILQPGPAALSDGLEQIHQILSNWNKNYNR